MLLREFVEFMNDPTQGVVRRQNLNKKFYKNVSKRKLSPPARIAIYAMDVKGRMMAIAQDEFTNPQDYAAFYTKYYDWDLTPPEKQPLPVSSPCYSANVTPEWGMPAPGIKRIEPTSVPGGKRSIKIVGEGLIPEVLEVYFISQKTQASVPAKVQSASATGDYRCGTVEVSATFPNTTDTYSLSAASRADYLTFELPSQGALLTVTVAPSAKKKAAKKKSAKKSAKKKRR